METIKNYLDNMFASLPKTARLADLKNNILSNMEEKYNELKHQGKSENEAIGIVISEFGNIDELVNELGIRKDDNSIIEPLVKEEEVTAYLKVKKTMGIQIGIGVFLCILAPATLILLSSLFDSNILDLGFSGDANSIIGLIAMFILIAIAVAIFIYSGMNFERYQYMEKGVQLPSSLRDKLQHDYDAFNPTYYLSIVIGVCLIILSPIVLFITSMMADEASNYGVVILLTIISVAVFIFIYFGSIREGYSRLLRIGDYAPKQEKENKVIAAVASIVWPLAVIIFLINGFVYNNWHIAWIVFPITGILFAMFSAAYSIITGKSEQ